MRYSGVDFFNEGLINIHDIEYIGICAHGAAEWLNSSEKCDILQSILNQKINIRILVNSVKTVQPLDIHMKHPIRRYTGYGTSIKKWLGFMEDFPDLVQIRIADIPILRRLYLIKGKKSGIMNVSYYTYNNHNPKNNYKTSFSYPSEEFYLYSNEFDYLWTKCSHFPGEKPEDLLDNIIN